MIAMVSQINGISIVCSTVSSGPDQRKHQSSASLAFVRGTHWRPVDYPHKGQYCGKYVQFQFNMFWNSLFEFMNIEESNDDTRVYSYYLIKPRVFKSRNICSTNPDTYQIRRTVFYKHHFDSLTHRGPVDLRKWAIFNTILMSPKSWLSQEDLDVGCEHSMVPMDS